MDRLSSARAWRLGPCAWTAWVAVACAQPVSSEAPGPQPPSTAAASSSQLQLSAAAGPTRSQLAAAPAPDALPLAAAPMPSEARALPLSSGIGSRVFVVERASGSLAVYDLSTRSLLPARITGLGDLTHATMVFGPELGSAYLSTRSGKLTRIDLLSLQPQAAVFTSQNSIDTAISQDGRFIATAEYVPGGATILDARSLQVVKRFAADESRVTGMVDAPGNRFVCVTMEGAQVWVIDASGTADAIRISARVPLTAAEPYDAMITPDGRHYLVGHLHTDQVSVVEVEHPERGARTISLRDPARHYDKTVPVKLPHMAAWAVAGERVFVPLVGEKRLAVLDRATFRFVASVPLRGNPVYAVRAPSEREIWVSFSGPDDDAWIEVVDAQRLEVTHSLRVGRRIYHMDFTPRGGQVLVTANQDDTLALVDAHTYQVVDRQHLQSPSGVFGVWRAFRLGL